MRNVRRKWLLVITVTVAIFALSPGWLGQSIWLATALANTLVVLLVVGGLGWFAYRICLAPRVKLRRLHRIRVRQGRRHPLA
ncbi:MAG TPA: hypothetical protein VD837_18175 [Terriglobales bacterium]|nr:hypothetical protein [Terriglobales bacterium]